MSETSLTGRTLAEIKTSIDNQKVINDLINTFFTTTTSKDVSVAYSEIIEKLNEIAEVRKAINEQKLTSEIINKLCVGINPQDITRHFSAINEYFRDQEYLKIRALLNRFLFNTDDKRMTVTGEIKANYLDIYRDIYNLKKKQ